MKASRGALLLALLAALGAARSAPADHLDHLFPFRFLTRTLPEAVAGRDYRARVLTINPKGPVSFSSPGLPPGLALDAATGELTGRIESAGTLALDIRASDGLTEIALAGDLLEVVPGPSGPAPGALATVALPEGRNGVPYEATLQVDGGVGPFAFGADGLPTGLHLDGRTGRIHGTPDFQGTARVQFTVRDDGAGGTSEGVRELVVFPPGSQFRFTTRALNPFGNYVSYNRLQTTGETGPVTFAGPGGYLFGVNPDEGWVGVDFEFMSAGVSTTHFTASDGTDEIRVDLPFHVLVSNYDFHWELERLPVGFVGVPYGDGVPVRLSTANAPVPVSRWAETSLPPGLSFDRETGLLSGVPSRAGLYKCWVYADFDSTLSSLGERTDFFGDLLILPTGGGDASSIAVNYWAGRQRVREGPAGATHWSGEASWNADRRGGRLLDSITHRLGLTMPPLGVPVPVKGRRRTPAGWSYSGPFGYDEPLGRVQVGVNLREQSIRWRIRQRRTAFPAPAEATQGFYIGNEESFRARVRVEDDGSCRDVAAGSAPAFVVSRGRIGVGDEAEVTLSGHLRDAGMEFDPGVSALRIRVLDGRREVVARDFTDLGREVLEAVPGGGEPRPGIRTAPDDSATARVARFAYSDVTGKFDLRMDRLAIGGLPRDEAHLGVELTIGERVYFTAVTFFERSPGQYGTTAPRR